MREVWYILSGEFIVSRGEKPAIKFIAAWLFVVTVAVAFVFYRGMSGDSQWQQDHERWIRAMEEYQSDSASVMMQGLFQIEPPKTVEGLLMAGLVGIVGILSTAIVALWKKVKEKDSELHDRDQRSVDIMLRSTSALETAEGSINLLREQQRANHEENQRAVGQLIQRIDKILE